MKLKHAYLLLAILGAVLPYTQFIPWIAENGLNISLLLNEIVSSRIAAFGWLDVLISVVTILVFVFSEGKKNPVPHLWLPVLGSLTIGASFGLPIFLYLREEA